MRRLLLGLIVLTPAVAFAQSAGEVERCFQNPSSCSWSGGVPTPLPHGGAPAPAPVASTAPAAPRAPDYTTVLQSPEADRRKLQESLRTLDKYNGPIDGNLQSEATTKAISEWQKGHGYNAVGKLTPTEAVTLNNEAAKAPIKRLDPSAQAAAAAPPSNADVLKSLQAKLAERRKAAEPKANAATQALLKDLKAYVAAGGKGVAGEQFADFANGMPRTRRPAAPLARSCRRSRTMATPKPVLPRPPRCALKSGRATRARRNAWCSPGSRAARARTRKLFPATTSPRPRSGRPTRC